MCTDSDLGQGKRCAQILTWDRQKMCTASQAFITGSMNLRLTQKFSYLTKYHSINLIGRSITIGQGALFNIK